jgi:hypothetical protein
LLTAGCGRFAASAAPCSVGVLMRSGAARWGAVVNRAGMESQSPRIAVAPASKK